MQGRGKGWDDVRPMPPLHKNAWEAGQCGVVIMASELRAVCANDDHNPVPNPDRIMCHCLQDQKCMCMTCDTKGGGAWLMQRHCNCCKRMQPYLVHGEQGSKWRISRLQARDARTGHNLQPHRACLKCHCLQGRGMHSARYVIQGRGGGGVALMTGMGYVRQVDGGAQEGPVAAIPHAGRAGQWVVTIIPFIQGIEPQPTSPPSQDRLPTASQDQGCICMRYDPNYRGAGG
jgi:hypothetical protein